MKVLIKKFSIMFFTVIIIFVMSIGAYSDGNTATPSADTPPGWQKASYEEYTFSLPKDWKGNEDTGIWCPGDQNSNMGRPKISLHIGAIPVMSGSFKDKLKFYYNATPTTIKKIKRCGMNGNLVEVTKNGIKHLALILEDASSSMKILHFVDCQAPEKKFDEYKGIFEKILNSVKCN